MDDKNIWILFAEIFNKILSESDAIQLNVITHGTIFYYSCLKLLTSTQSGMNQSLPTDNTQLLNVMQIFLKTNANSGLSSMPPPIIPQLMHIGESNQNCNVHYAPIITEFIIKMENKETMNDYERLSKSARFVYIIEIICGYHHHNLSFWTVYPSQSSLASSDQDPEHEGSSEYDIIEYQSNKDGDSTEFGPQSIISDRTDDSTDHESYADMETMPEFNLCSAPSLPNGLYLHPFFFIVRLCLHSKICFEHSKN